MTPQPFAEGHIVPLHPASCSNTNELSSTVNRLERIHCQQDRNVGSSSIYTFGNRLPVLNHRELQ